MSVWRLLVRIGRKTHRALFDTPRRVVRCHSRLLFGGGRCVLRRGHFDMHRYAR